MITEILQGFFDVREWDAKLERQQRPIIADGKNIAFTVIGDTATGLPNEKTVQNKNGETRFVVKFKIGKSCHFYDETGNDVARPHHADLDGKRYEVRIDYVNLTPSKPLAPSGLWAHSILFREVKQNPFEGLAFTPTPTPTPTTAPDPTPYPTDSPVEMLDSTDDLPF